MYFEYVPERVDLLAENEDERSGGDGLPEGPRDVERLPADEAIPQTLGDELLHRGHHLRRT